MEQNKKNVTFGGAEASDGADVLDQLLTDVFKGKEGNAFPDEDVGCLLGGLMRDRAVMPVDAEQLAPDKKVAAFVAGVPKLLADPAVLVPVSSIPAAPSTPLILYLYSLHQNGHSCVTNVFSTVYETDMPHGTRTIAAASKFAGTRAIRRLQEKMSYKLLTMDMTGRDGSHDRHVSLVRSSCASGSNVWVKAGARVEWKIWDTTVFLGKDSAEVDRFLEKVCCADKWPDSCISCGRVPEGKKHCHTCGFVVVADGHSKRCRPQMLVSVTERRAAQVGDALHRLDVVIASLDGRWVENERGPWIAEKVSAAAQAKWMRDSGPAMDDTSEGALSTKFEAGYLKYRESYLSQEFQRLDLVVFPAYSEHTLGPIAWSMMRASVEGETAFARDHGRYDSYVKGLLDAPYVDVPGKPTKDRLENQRCLARGMRAALDNTNLSGKERSSYNLILRQRLSDLTKRYKDAPATYSSGSEDDDVATR